MKQNEQDIKSAEKLALSRIDWYLAQGQNPIELILGADRNDIKAIKQYGKCIPEALFVSTQLKRLGCHF